MCLADALLPIGSGQRQLILGDRFIGKTSIYLTLVIVSGVFSYIVGMDGLGSRRLYAIYIGIGQSLTKIYKLINLLGRSWLFNVICTHSSFNSVISLLVVFCGVVLAEKLKLKGFNSVIAFDDINAHAKSYRQISLIIAKIPSRDAYPADIFNIHSGLLERICKVSIAIGGSITGLPIIELQNSNITDYIATNIISITDGQFYLSAKLFVSSIRPAFDSGLSVSRIGGAAQLKYVKIVGLGVKNTLTYLRKEVQLNSELRLVMLLGALSVVFGVGFLQAQSIEYSVVLLLVYRLYVVLGGSLVGSISRVHLVRVDMLLCMDWFYVYYVLVVC
jgi:F-type H+-transporting ATPase subunit alpha